MLSKTIDWEITYKLPFYCSNPAKLITFQFKLIHRHLATNNFLNKIGIRENDIVPFIEQRSHDPFFIYFDRVARCLVFKAVLYEIIGHLPKNQIPKIFTPDIIIIIDLSEVGHPIQHKAVFLRPCYLILNKNQKLN